MELRLTMKKKFGTMDKIVVQWTKLWHISGTIEVRITKEMKNMVEYKKLRNFDLS